MPPQALAKKLDVHEHTTEVDRRPHESTLRPPSSLACAPLTEGRLAHDMPSTVSLKPKGGGAAEEAQVWAAETVEMLRRIRSDICSHIPEVPLEGHVEEFLEHLSEFPYFALMTDLKLRLYEMSRSRIPDLHINARISSVKVVPHLALSSLPSTDELSGYVGRILSSNKVPKVLHRTDGHDSPLEKATKEVAVALKKSVNGGQLVTYVDLPYDWKNNRWVIGGYRFIPLHKWEFILLSLFALHNETLNIHTHSIPLFHTVLRYIPFFKENFEPMDRPELIYTLFSMLCLSSSVVWHTMAGCAHFVSMDFCARVDYVGIGWLISASIWTIVHYGFYCDPEMSFILKTLCLATGVAGSIFPFMKWFNDIRYKPLRIVVFIAMAFTGLAPLAQLTVQRGFSGMLSFIGPLLPSFASYCIGFLFYVTEFPESYFNSTRIAYWTDWLGGGSHAIWHVFIAIAMYLHKWGMREMSSNIVAGGCVVN